MNYLAHALLSGHAAGSGYATKVLVGNLMGDFVKGPLTGDGDGEVGLGLWLHRRIDSFTDSHALPRRSRGRISPARRRFAGVIIDLAYDHFLAVNWERFCDVTLTEFIATVYTTLECHAAHLPPPMRTMLPRMIGEDWLGSYRTLAGLDAVMRRVGTRLSRANTLGGGTVEVAAGYGRLQADFLAFFPELSDFARAEMRSRSAVNRDRAPERRAGGGG